ERSMELILRHLPPHSVLQVYAGHPLHVDALCRPGALPEGARLLRFADTVRPWGLRRAALRLAFECLRHPDAVLLINTHASAMVAAMAARLVPALGARCHLYVRDFGWTGFDHLFGRLPGACVLVPSRAVLARRGYLAPFHVQPVGAAACSVMPCMVELPVESGRDDGRVLHLASVNGFKGHVDLMLAVHRLQQQGRALSVLSCGVVDDASLNRHLHRFIDKLGIRDCFRLEGYLADPQHLLRDCRMVVVPSVSHSGGPETFGRTVIEAWAWRKPVVGYACGGVEELIEHEVDGLLVPEGDVDGLADALHRLSSDPAFARRLGEAGHAKVVARYEAGVVVHALHRRLCAE
ncbi:MAG: glycosyltransferase family 4 protein, partial [Pseudazoarcus pumilus]|nr:glycosyltransferase family 4 protein [Pseudazoarcus pumilus]